MINVVVLDDHPIARRGMVEILAESGTVDVLASIKSLDDFAPVLQSCPQLDVIVADLYLDGEVPSFTVIERLLEAARVLVVSASGRPADVLRAIRAGVAGYITKSCSPDMFRSAVATVAAHGFVLSSDLADVLQGTLAMDRLIEEDTAILPALSQREEQTLSYIARGLTHAQIASRLHVRPTTVDTYVERIRRKLQVGNKAELTRAALGRAVIGRARPSAEQ